jgi:hypothetical protein
MSISGRIMAVNLAGPLNLGACTHLYWEVIATSLRLPERGLPRCLRYVTKGS